MKRPGAPVDELSLRRPAGHRPPPVIHVPSDPSGTSLATLIRDTRLAIARGDVVIDTGPARTWTPGPRLVLQRLRALADHNHRRWHDLAGDPADDTSDVR